MSLILRRDKGSALTRDELDDNLEYLEQNGGGGGVKSLHYIAALSQTGTDAPVATVIRNDFDGEIVWSRDGLGLYFGTLTGIGIGEVRIIPPFGSIQVDIEPPFQCGVEDDNSIFIQSKDDRLRGAGKSYIEIIKYLD